MLFHLIGLVRSLSLVLRFIWFLFKTRYVRFLFHPFWHWHGNGLVDAAWIFSVDEHAAFLIRFILQRISESMRRPGQTSERPATMAGGNLLSGRCSVRQADIMALMMMVVVYMVSALWYTSVLWTWTCL